MIDKINASEFIDPLSNNKETDGASGKWSGLGARAEHIACASGSDYGSPRWIKQYNRALSHLKEISLSFVL
jgi:hypothetical protein